VNTATERMCPEMMDGMYGIGVAMMIIGSVAALAVLTR
jgi:hypothetical protein